MALIDELLDMIAELRNNKLTTIGIACNFARRLVQPIKDGAH